MMDKMLYTTEAAALSIYDYVLCPLKSWTPRVFKCDLSSI